MVGRDVRSHYLGRDVSSRVCVGLCCIKMPKAGPSTAPSLRFAWACSGRDDRIEGVTAWKILTVAIFWLWPQCLVRKRLGVAHPRLLRRFPGASVATFS